MCLNCFLSVSELLMGEVDSSTLLSLLPTEKSRVSERLKISVSGAIIYVQLSNYSFLGVCEGQM